MSEKIETILIEIKEMCQKILKLLETMMQLQSASKAERYAKYINYLKINKRATKHDFHREFDISLDSIRKDMEDLGKRNDCAYVPGRGNKPGYLIYGNSSLEKKVYELLKKLPRGREMNNAELLIFFATPKSKFPAIIKTLRENFPDEFQFNQGNLRRIDRK